MNAIRSVLVFLWIVVSVIPMGLALVLCSLFLRDDKLWWWFAVPWLRGVIGAARLIAGVKYRIHGEENLPPAHDMRRIVLCPKHQSTWETFFFPSMTPHPVSYVFKKELLRIPHIRLGHGAPEHGAYRPKPADPGLEQGGGAGAGADGSRQMDHYVPRGNPD